MSAGSDSSIESSSSVPPPNDPVIVQSVSIDRMVAGGEGFARHEDGRVMFVRGAVAGDHVDVLVLEQRRDWLRGVVANIAVPSPERVRSTCASRHEGCGGCDWAEVSESSQLDFKSDIVREALRRTARLDIPVDTGQSVTRNNYRTSVRVVGTDEGRAGFRRQSDDATVAAPNCEVVVEQLAAILREVSVPSGVEVNLRVSVATGESTARWDRRAGEVGGLPYDASVGPNARLTERVTGRDLIVSAGSFFQSGPQAAGVLVDAVKRFAPELADASHVVDAYGGVGLFAVCAVPDSTAVTVVETSRAALADAEVNLNSRAGSVSLVRAEFGRWRTDATDIPPDVIIADPARSGLGRPGVNSCVRAAPRVIVLVSCDPVSFARDAALLATDGYLLERVEAHDLFPGTHHVEVVSRFVRAGTLRG